VPLPYENTLPTSSGVPVGLVVVLQASVFPYGIACKVAPCRKRQRQA